ncbi:hypothetical protein ABEX25_27280 [Paenibacillus thiaminolyticus]|uniref:hypothetical protein n=1 Tax=Paenibacillus thiaminolyticus TaxID=49283 RepID=UPI003D278073
MQEGWVYKVELKVLINDEEIQLKVTNYDFQKAAHSILAGECPYKEDFAEHILNPPYEGP